MIITDTHAHIYLPEFADTRKEMLERAEKEGVTKILLPAIDSESHASLVNLAKEFPGLCRPMMGLHPCYVKANYREELKIARDYLEQGGFVAVGEIGLDFYWDKTFTEQQYLAFEEQIRWAMEFDLPIAIHSRNSTDECIEVVRRNQHGKLKGVFHCFSGNAEQAQQIMDLGFYLGIGGVVTFKNGGLDKGITVSDDTILEKVIGLVKDRCQLLTDFVQQSDYFFKAPETIDTAAVKPKWNEAKQLFFAELIRNYELATDWEAHTLENNLKEIAAVNDLKPGELMLPLRIMLVGGKFGPGVFDIAAILGKAETIKRMETALALLK